MFFVAKNNTFLVHCSVFQLLIYLTITRPNLSLLSQFMQTPRDIHLNCAKRVLRYVSGTMDYDILYKSATPIRLEGYIDAY